MEKYKPNIYTVVGIVALVIVIIALHQPTRRWLTQPALELADSLGLEPGPGPEPVAAALLPEAQFLKDILTTGAYPTTVKDFYAARRYEPVWIDEDGDMQDQAVAYLAAMGRAKAEGLRPQDYRATELKTQLENTEDLPFTEQAETEIQTTRMLLAYIHDLRHGRKIDAKLQPGMFLDAQPKSAVELLQTALTLDEDEVGAYFEHLVPPHKEYAQLRQALADSRASLQKEGEWVQVSGGGLIRPGETNARIPVIRQRLIQQGFIAPNPAAVIGPHLPDSDYDESLVVAVKAFQARHGLEADGVIGPTTIEAMNVTKARRIEQIMMAMERWRWLPDDLGDRHLRVNIAAFQVEAYKHGKPEFQMAVITGQTAHKTPLFSTTMERVIFQPYWYAPKRLAAEYILPKIRDYPLEGMEHFGYELLRQENGKMVKVDDPGALDWANLSEADFPPYRFRQKPGFRNALGHAKFEIKNNQSIYLHGTPQQSLFSEAQRAFSSGCIRLEDPLRMAQFVLEENQKWTPERIENTYNRSANYRPPKADEAGPPAPLKEFSPTYVNLETPVYVYLVYWTAWPDADGNLHFREDVYGHDHRLSTALGFTSINEDVYAALHLP